MSNHAAFCREQADKQRADAAEAVLTNVKERCERAASTWDVMATRAERAEKLRAGRQPAGGEAAALALMDED